MTADSAIAAYLAYLATEKRAAALTVEAYGHDLRVFLQFLSGHLGRTLPSPIWRRCGKPISAPGSRPRPRTGAAGRPGRATSRRSAACSASSRGGTASIIRHPG